MNPLLLTDVYNLSHQYMKCNTDWEVSQIVNRSAPMILFGFEQTTHDILHYNIRYEHIEEAEKCARRMGMIFPAELFHKLLLENLDPDGYGSINRLPLKVEALPDGSWVPKGTPFAQISNTIEGFGELVTWFEGMFLHAWFPSACATRALYMKQYLMSRNERLNRFHSFGFRGHRSLEDAYWAAHAWSLFLPGTDDFLVMQTPDVIGVSIPAVAHKVVMNYNNEWDCYRHVLMESKRLGYTAVSIVIDTNSSKVFIEKYLRNVQALAELIGIKPIYRPDSGDVMAQARQIVQTLGDGCDYEQDKPYSKYGIIIGDSVNFIQAQDNDEVWKSWGFPTDMLTWGIGAGFYNDLQRDTLGWSMKTAYSNGKDRMKKTDDAYKRSIPGKVSLRYNTEGQLSACTAKPTTDYKVLGAAVPTFDTIKQIANSQDTTQQTLNISDELNMKIVDYK